MDNITIAMVAALLVKEKHGAGSVSLQDAYTRVRDVLISTADAADELRNVLVSLEANPTSPTRQLALDELLTTIPVDQQVRLLPLVGDLVEQVRLHHHGTRIIRQMYGYFDDLDGDVYLDRSKTKGLARIIRRRKSNQTLGPVNPARPAGDPVILAKEPPPPEEQP